MLYYVILKFVNRINTTPISLKSFYRKIEVDLVSSKNTKLELGWAPKSLQGKPNEFLLHNQMPFESNEGAALVWFGQSHIIHLQMSPRSQMEINYPTTNFLCFRHDMVYLAYQNATILSMF